MKIFVESMHAVTKNDLISREKKKNQRPCFVVVDLREDFRAVLVGRENPFPPFSITTSFFCLFPLWARMLTKANVP